MTLALYDKAQWNCIEIIERGGGIEGGEGSKTERGRETRRERESDAD